jgi:hypothetical protein
VGSGQYPASFVVKSLTDRPRRLFKGGVGTPEHVFGVAVRAGRATLIDRHRFRLELAATHPTSRSEPGVRAERLTVISRGELDIPHLFYDSYSSLTESLSL